MIGIEQFSNAAKVAEQQNRSLTFNLTADKTNLRSTGTGLVRWVRNLNTANNREIANQFVDALEKTYGRDVVAATGLSKSLVDGKPLAARRISQALGLAAETKAQFADANKNSAASFLQKAESGTDTSMFHIKYAGIAKSLLGDSAAAQLISQADFGEIGRAFEAEVAGISDEGKTFVTSEKLDEIASKHIVNHIATAYGDNSKELISLTHSGSLSRQGLARLNAQDLPDNTIRLLRDAGITLSAPKRLGQANKAALSTAARAEIQSQLDSMVNVGREPVTDGVLNQFKKDVGRATYRLHGEDLGKDKATVINRLREFCQDDAGQVNEQMLLGISKFAYQASNGTVWSLFGPGNEHLAPFQGLITTDHEPEELSYDVSRNASGGVDIQACVRTKTGSMTSLQGEMTYLNPEKSHFGVELQISLDAETMAPTLQAVSIDYALYEAAPTQA